MRLGPPRDDFSKHRARPFRCDRFSLRRCIITLLLFIFSRVPHGHFVRFPEKYSLPTRTVAFERFTNISIFCKTFHVIVILSWTKNIFLWRCSELTSFLIFLLSQHGKSVMLLKSFGPQSITFKKQN